MKQNFCAFLGCCSILPDGLDFCNSHKRASIVFHDSASRLIPGISKEESVFLYQHLNLMRENGSSNLKEDGPLLLEFSKTTLYAERIKRMLSHKKFLSDNTSGCRLSDLGTYLGLSDAATKHLGSKIPTVIKVVEKHQHKWVEFTALKNMLWEDAFYIEIHRILEGEGISPCYKPLAMLSDMAKSGKFGKCKSSLYHERMITLPILQYYALQNEFLSQASDSKPRAVRTMYDKPGRVSSTTISKLSRVSSTTGLKWIKKYLSEQAVVEEYSIYSISTDEYIHFLRNAVDGKYAISGVRTFNHKTIARFNEILEHWEKHGELPSTKT